MRISSAIPNLINGVSQQPISQRLTSQAEEQINGLSSVVGGLSKRPPTEYVAKLSTDTALGTPFLHTISRDSSERYKVIVDDSYDIRVWDIDGSAKTVNYDDKIVLLQDDAVAVGDGGSELIYIPKGVTTVLLVTNGITTATVVWEADTDPLFSSPTTLRTDTTDTSGTVSWTASADNGRYVRARISAWTAGTIDATLTYKSITYLFRDSAALNTHIRAVTIADYTLFLNTKAIPAMMPALSPTRDFEVMAFAKQGFPGNDHTVTIDGNSATHAIASAGDGDTKLIIDAWDAALTATLEGGSPAFTVVARNPIYYASRSTDFEASVEDGAGGAALTVVKDKIQRFSELPKIAHNGFHIQITGDNASSFANYYAEFNTVDDSAGINEGNWSETIAQGVEFEIEKQTMPHQLVREADGTFTWGEVAWGDRKVGDANNNPNPSFIGTPIHDIFLFRNRLGFLAGQNIIMSRAGEFFEYFHETVTDVLPTTVIDVSASTASGAKGVAVLFHAAAFDRTLLLFSSQQQLVLTALDVLTPASVQIDSLTEYTADEFAEPAGSGDSIFSPTIRGAYSSIMEYRLPPDADVPNAVEVTGHIPTYMQGSITQMTAAANENMLVLTTDNDNTTLFVHTYFWAANEKLQSSWSKWNFNDAQILDIAFLDSDLYMVVQRTDGVWLEKVRVSVDHVDEDTGDYLTHLDRKITEADFTSLSYTGWSGLTTGVLPFTPQLSITHKAITRTGAAVKGANLAGVTLYGATENLAKHSNIFSPGWTTVGISINTGITDPNGGSDGQELVEDTSTGNHRLAQGMTVTNATTHTISIWVQADSREWTRISAEAAVAPVNCFLYFNASTGAFGDIGTGVDSYKVTLGGDGWHRVEMQFTPTAAGSLTSVVRLAETGVAGGYSYTGDGVSNMHFYGFQLEEYATATPLLVTTTTTVSVSGQITLNGDQTSELFYFGEEYLFEYTFSTAVIREDAPGGRGRHMAGDGTVVVLGYLINFSQTGHFQVEVTHGHAGTISTHIYNGKPVGEVIIGDTSLHDDVFYAPVKTKNTDATIKLKSTSFIPCKFQSAEWVALWNPRRGRRV